MATHDLAPSRDTYVTLGNDAEPHDDENEAQLPNEEGPDAATGEASASEPPVAHKHCSLQAVGIASLISFAFLWLLLFLLLGPLAVVLYPFFFVPLGGMLLVSYRFHNHLTTVGNLLFKFATGFVCMAFVFMMQLVLAMGVIVIALLVRGSQAAAVRHFLELIYLCCVAIPIPEGLVLYQVTVQRTHRHNKSFIVNALYTNLGYATAQAMMVSLLIGMPKKPDDFSAINFGAMLLYALLYFLWCGPMQMLAGYLQGLIIAEAQETDQPIPFVRAQIMPYCFRSTYYLLFTVPALLTAVWKLPSSTPIVVFFVGAALLFLGFIVFIKKVERRLPPSYLARVGYLNAFGYGLLPQVEELTTQDKEMTEVA
eukprot:TRINITY_DN3526_c0_g1_i1.p1 TRINITY_DN3526_c0_g1~~TRINITY_DN3526_c0_g1_i1.p1  ORF type:complete len:368 (+),score=68.96 TRINITY_DN3526_c0_g1_i1:138-1241(+)